MNSDIINKLDEIIMLIDNSDDIKKFTQLKKDFLKNDELIRDISLIKNDSLAYGNDYISLKEKILSNEDFKELKLIENDLYFLVQEMNLRLKNMLKEVKNENN